MEDEESAPQIGPLPPTQEEQKINETVKAAPETETSSKKKRNKKKNKKKNQQ